MAQPEPPRIAAWLAGLLVPAAFRDAMLGDWRELHREICDARGRFAASGWYWRQVLLAVTFRLRLRRSRASAGIDGGAIVYSLTSAARTLWRHPLYAATAILVLALGVGTATASFSLLHTIVMQPLSFDPDERVVAFWQGGNWSLHEFDHVRERQRVHSALAAHTGVGRRLMAGDEGSELVEVASATADFFDVFDLRAERGRLFARGDEAAGGAPVAVLAYGFWQRRFAGDPSVIGESIELDDAEHTIIGVAPAGFWYPAQDIDAWVATRIDSASELYLYAHMFRLVGRLGPGAGLQHARDEARALGRSLGAAFEYGEGFSKADDGDVTALRRALVGGASDPLAVLVAGVACLLAIACANVAGLQVNRVLGRLHEHSLRISLGASRARLVMERLAESLVLAALGGALGVLVARVTLRLVVSVLPADTPRLADVSIDANALGWALALSLVTAVLVGIIPAVVVARTEMKGSIEHGRATQGLGPSRTRRTLVVVETALAVVLVLSAGLLARSFAGLVGAELGFRTERILTVEVSAPSGYEGAVRAELFEQIMTRTTALADVVSTGAVQRLPLSPGWSLGLETGDGGEAAPGVEAAGSAAPWRSVMPGYFGTLGIAVTGGRDFDHRDVVGAPLVTIVNQQLAETYWPGRDPIGRRLRSTIPGSPWLTVVGVVEDARVTRLSDEVPPTFYQPYAQAPGSSSLHLVVRTRGAPRSVMAPLRQIVAEADARLAIGAAQTLREVVDRTVQQPRGLTTLLAVFAAIALLLGALGLFGIMSHDVARRTREIGLRLTLGSTRVGVVTMVVREGLVLATAGLALGLALSLGLGRTLESNLYGVTSTDPATWIGVMVCLLITSLVASGLPALRASRVDPIEALRQ